MNIVISDIKHLNSLITSKKIIKFTNCFIHQNSTIIPEDLYIRNGLILNVDELFFNEKAKADITLDCQGCVISSGFIDIQINGGYGRDFSDSSQDINESIEIVGKYLVKHGVTSFCPTIVTSEKDFYSKILSQKMKKAEGSAQSIGFHLEGPFLSKTKRGMHNEALVNSNQESDPAQILNLVYGENLSQVRYVTLAPELNNAIELIKYLISKNIIVSIGHSSASFVEGVNAFDNGATLMTHLFCAMNPFHHRDPGLVGLLTYKQPNFPNKIFYFGLITDLVHTHETAIKLAYKANRRGLIVVTDANCAMGLKDGSYQFGHQHIDVENGVSYLHNTKTLAGATTPLDICLKNYYKTTNSSLGLALDAVTKHPSEAMKMIKKKGLILPGYIADLTIISNDNNISVQMTWINGKSVYLRKKFLLKAIIPS